MCPGSDTPVSFYRYILGIPTGKKTPTGRSDFRALRVHRIPGTAPVYRRRRERQVRESADSRAADNITAIHADYCVPRFSWRELLDHWNSICLLIDASF